MSHLPNLDTCSMNDIIATSIAMHRTTLGEVLRAQASIHLQAANSLSFSKEGSHSARDMHDAAYSMAHKLLAGETVEPESLTFSQRIIAFGAACKLLCIPHHIGQGIAARS